MAGRQDMGAPIFVVGYQHTGTTLMQYLLGKNRDVFSVRHESKYFEYLDLTRRRFPRLSTPADRDAFVRYVAGVVEHGYPVRDGMTVDGHDVGGLAISLSDDEVAGIAAQSGHDPVQAFHAVNDLLAARQGKTRWLEKTPSHIFQIREILEWFPDARAIGMVRDPRDSLASKKSKRVGFATNTRVDQKRRKNMHLQLGYDMVLDAMSLRSAVRIGRVMERIQPERYMTIRYEDLVGAPEEVVEQVCGFLGMAYDPSMLDVTATAGESRISSDRVGRWKQILSGSEMAVCQSVMKKELEAYGYEPEPVPLGAWIGTVGLYVRSGGDIVRRLSRKFRLGGPGYLINVLRNWARRWSSARAASRG